MEEDFKDVKEFCCEMKGKLECITPEKNMEISTEEKTKQQNRIRQMAFKTCKKMPKDYKSFCLVTAHFMKNAHHYWNICQEEAIKIKNEAEHEVGKKMDVMASPATECIEVNKALRVIHTLKRQNRIREQQCLVLKLRENVGSYRDITKASGTALKTVHEWCLVPKTREHKATSMAKLRKEEFVNFLMQDTITFSSPAKKEEFVNFLMQDTITFSSPAKRFAGKRFMVDTWAEIYKKYLQQPQFHKYGIISMSTMQNYKPKCV